MRCFEVCDDFTKLVTSLRLVAEVHYSMSCAEM